MNEQFLTFPELYIVQDGYNDKQESELSCTPNDTKYWNRSYSCVLIPCVMTRCCRLYRNYLVALTKWHSQMAINSFCRYWVAMSLHLDVIGTILQRTRFSMIIIRIIIIVRSIEAAIQMKTVGHLIQTNSAHVYMNCNIKDNGSVTRH